MEGIRPFSVVEHDQDKASIILEADMKYQLFEKHGIEPNGYAWEKAIKTYLEKNHPEIANLLSYDSEAGMFACYGSKAIIKEAARYLVALYNNDGLLEDHIATI